jgi:hypothetical protein
MDQSLDRKKDRIEKGLPSFENAFKVRTDWFDKKRHDDNKEPSLNSSCAHVTFARATPTRLAKKPLPYQQFANQEKIVLI